MTNKTLITVAHGDGIGPEIMEATLKILQAANAPLEYDTIEVGKKVYEQGFTSGIPDSAWDSLEKTKVLLKGPITTPQGGGYKSLNVTIRKTLGLYANVRPCVSLHPFVPTNHPTMDVVIIRENEEDLYTGIEYQQHPDVMQCLKLITRPGCERIVRYAFEYAKKYNRKKVTCFVKDNIMKMTDGLFASVFKEIAQEYCDIQSDCMIVDIGTAKLAVKPEMFDVIVTENLYGDIISDVAAEVVGSVGLAGSANIGEDFAMFEAIHGSAPDIAGKDMGNPSGLLNSAIQMLVHLKYYESANLIQNAWLKTLEDGVHTGDIYRAEHSQEKVGTQGFADAVIKRLGQKPTKFTQAAYGKELPSKIVCVAAPKDDSVCDQVLVGVDVFINNACSIDDLGKDLSILPGSLKLEMIDSMGIKIWPQGIKTKRPVFFCRCRFKFQHASKMMNPQDVIVLLQQLAEKKIMFVKTEHLYTFNGKNGFTLAQGE